MEDITDSEWFEKEAKRKTFSSLPSVEEAKNKYREYQEAQKSWLAAEKALSGIQKFIMGEWLAAAKLLFRQTTTAYLDLWKKQQEAWHVACDAGRQRDEVLAQIDQFLDQGLAIHDQGYIARKTIFLAMVGLTICLGSFGYSSRLAAQSGRTPQASAAVLKAIDDIAVNMVARIYKCDAALLARQGFDGLAELTGPIEAEEFIQALNAQPFDREKCRKLADEAEKLRQALQRRAAILGNEVDRYRQEYAERLGK